MRAPCRHAAVVTASPPPSPYVVFAFDATFAITPLTRFIADGVYAVAGTPCRHYAYDAAEALR